MNEAEAMDAVGKGVIARDGQGDEYGRGIAVAYSIVPTLTIRRDDGSQFTWRHDMCELAPPPSLIGKRVRTVVEGTLERYDEELGAYTLRTDPRQHVPWEMQFHWATEFEAIED